MEFFRRFAPWRALNDLRRFLAQRQKHELIFLCLSVVITGLLVIGFAIDSHEEIQYHRDITYFQNWRADRTDAQIIAQQKADLPKEAAAKRAQAEREAAVRADFKKLDDKLNRWGL